MNYYIQGDAANADKIKAAFEKLGIDVLDFGFADKTVVYCSIGGACVQSLPYSINLMNILHSHPDYKELKLPKPHYDIANFYAGMPVLARDKDNHKWCYLLYSHYDNTYEDGLCFNAGSVDWRQCIPFNDDTKHLLGTTDMPSEEYINW